jgi:hypothetical protein
MIMEKDYSLRVEIENIFWKRTELLLRRDCAKDLSSRVILNTSQSIS